MCICISICMCVFHILTLLTSALYFFLSLSLARVASTELKLKLQQEAAAKEAKKRAAEEVAQAEQNYADRQRIRDKHLEQDVHAAQRDIDARMIAVAARVARMSKNS